MDFAFRRRHPQSDVPGGARRGGLSGGKVHMSTCCSCGRTILFGGKRLGAYRFCSGKCRAQGSYLVVADKIPDATVVRLARRIHAGPCPECHGPGPVDVYNAYFVWSALVLTSWKTVPNVVCQSCGSREQGRALLSSLVLGWWGAWGLLVTPMQIVKNIWAMNRQVSPTEPSAQLLHVARVALASQIAAQEPPPSL